MVSLVWVEKPLIEKRKFGQGGEKGRTRKVMVWDDQTPCWSRNCICSWVRLYTRKTEGARPSLIVALLGLGADTSTSKDLVISKTAVKMCSLVVS